MSKPDVTNIKSQFLVSGSKNVLINDGEKIQVRNGYSLLGDENTSGDPINSSSEWQTHRGVEIPLRCSASGTIEARLYSNWVQLYGYNGTGRCEFDTVWDSTEKQDFLLFVNGTSDMNMWSGGFTTFASATAATVTKEGSSSWAEEGFLTTGTRKFMIGAIEYTYTGGESTTTLTGVTPDPTAGAYDVGTTIVQAIRVTANTPASGFTNDLLRVHQNQVYVGSLTRRDVFVSKNSDYTSYTFASPRVPGEGALLTLDSACVGFEAQEDAMYISAGKSDWYQTQFTISSDNTKEALTIKKLKSGAYQGAFSQGAIAKIKNSIVFVSNEPTIDTLGRVENINTPNAKPLSDMIKSDLGGYNFTGVHVKYHRNSTYIALPAESLVLIYDHERQLWQPPQTLPIARLAIIGGELYGHSSQTTETYKLFDTTVFSDNGNPIEAVAAFAYRSFGARDHTKSHDEWFTEGYISTNTTLTLQLNYEYGGSLSVQEFDIAGDDTNILFSPTIDTSLGKSPLGSEPIGSSIVAPNDLQKFRKIHSSVRQDYYEIQAIYKSNDEDQRWELLAQGPNVVLATEDNTDIK